MEQETCSCRGPDNKVGIITGNVYAFHRITLDESFVCARSSLIGLPSTGCTRFGTSSFNGTRTNLRAAIRGWGSFKNSVSARASLNISRSRSIVRGPIRTSRVRPSAYSIRNNRASVCSGPPALSSQRNRRQIQNEKKVVSTAATLSSGLLHL